MTAALDYSDIVAETSRDANATGERIHIRPLTELDVQEVVALLYRGFPVRSEDYWRRGMYRLGERRLPDGWPRFGYALADGGRLVGILLTIFSHTDDGSIRVNLSGWYVEPSYRLYSGLLLAPLKKFDAATLFNISPQPHTFATIEAQGFRRYDAGDFYAVAALGPRAPGAIVREVRPGADSRLGDYAAYGRWCFEITDGAGVHPFVFAVARVFGVRTPIAQLAYCRSVDDFVRYSGPLGRRLLRKGLPLVRIDAIGPVPGLTGVFAPKRNSRYFRGPAQPRLGDLSETDLLIFGS